MGGRSAVVTSRGIRLALLVCTLLGLAAMHSLGHHGGPRPDARHGGPGHIAEFEASALVGQGAVAGQPAVPEHCLDRDCGHPVAEPAGSAGGHPIDWSVCLAVLSAVAVLLVIAGAARLVGAVAGRRTAAGGWRRRLGSRGPPRAPVGLRLATVSVVRR